MQQSIEESVNEIFELCQKYGGEDYIGEPVSQSEQQEIIQTMNALNSL